MTSAAPWKRHPEYEARLAQVSALRDIGYTHRQIAKQLGVSRQRVSQLLELLRHRTEAYVIPR